MRQPRLRAAARVPGGKKCMSRAPRRARGHVRTSASSLSRHAAAASLRMICRASRSVALICAVRKPLMMTNALRAAIRCTENASSVTRSAAYGVSEYSGVGSVAPRVIPQRCRDVDGALIASSPHAMRRAPPRDGKMPRRARFCAARHESCVARCQRCHTRDTRPRRRVEIAR